MSISKALEIEKIKPVQNGIYICTDAKNKKFELVKIEEIPVTIEEKTMCLGDFFYLILNKFNTINENINLIASKHNELLDAFKKKTIMDAIYKK